MEILYILLGWLLGILSPSIINYISHHYEKNALKRIIIGELKDMRKRLLWIPFSILPAYGMLDKNTFIWVKEQTNNFTEIEDECGTDENSKKMIAELRSKKDFELDNFLQKFNSYLKKEDPAFHFKKFETSIIDSNLINVGILDNNFLTKLLGVRFQINTLNEEIQSILEFLKMTFDSSITEINHQIIKKQIINKNYTISKKSIYIVKKINNIINDEK